MRMVLRFLRQQNPKALPLTGLAALVTFGIFLLVGFLIGSLILFILLGVLTSLTVAMFVFGRFTQRAQHRALAGQPGGGAAILEGLRGKWEVTPAVAGNRNFDVVHRAVGRPGVILVAEGSRKGMTQLLAAEKKRIARIGGEIPIYDFQVGEGENQVPISKLNGRIMRLPRNLRKPEVAELNNRLKAMPQRTGLPGGPTPKGAKMPKMPRNTRPNGR